MKRTITLLFIFLAFTFVFYAFKDKPTQTKKGFPVLFEELCDTISQHFYNPEFIEKQFPNIKETYRSKIKNVSDVSTYNSICNQMLTEFKTSHTYLYSSEEIAYYQLASIFGRLPNIKALFQDKEITYTSIGAFTNQIENQTFITAVLEGGAAAEAGLQKGDEILSVDGNSFHQISSFKGKEGNAVEIAVRSKKNGPIRKVEVIPRLINPQVEFTQAIESSIKIIDHGVKKIGYIHMWNYAGDHFHQILVDAVAWGKLQEADALILDLRNGWGGASPDYLNLFNKNTPTITFEDRNGKASSFDRIWRKPVALLVDETVRSGKEVLAYGFKKYQIGPVIGGNTAGAVTAGRAFVLSDGSILYLAVLMAKVDGEILEGIGVAPDIFVPNEIPYTEGKDNPLEKAINFF